MTVGFPRTATDGPRWRPCSGLTCAAESGVDPRVSVRLAGIHSSLRLPSATMNVMPSTGPSQSPADMLRRIRELQASGPAVGHVTGQHVTSKVVLKRFAEPAGPHRGLSAPSGWSTRTPGTGL